MTGNIAKCIQNCIVMIFLLLNHIHTSAAASALAGHRIVTKSHKKWDKTVECTGIYVKISYGFIIFWTEEQYYEKIGHFDVDGSADGLYICSRHSVRR